MANNRLKHLTPGRIVAAAICFGTVLMSPAQIAFGRHLADRNDGYAVGVAIVFAALGVAFLLPGFKNELKRIHA